MGLARDATLPGVLNRSFIARSVHKAQVRTEVLLKAGGTSDLLPA